MKTLNKVWLVVMLFCIFAPLNNARGESLPSTTAQGFAFTRDLSIGVRGDDVSRLQQFLIVGGFLKASTSTGFFGSITKTSLGNWQKAIGIYPASGLFGPLSRKKINMVVAQVLTQGNKSQDGVGTTTGAIMMAINSKDGSPMRLNISKIGVDASFQYTGLTALGIMETPNNITDVGWYTKSVRPGEKGVSVITGHVAQIRGGKVTKQGVFFKLNELSIGDKLEVTNNRGEVVTFVVRESRSYDPSADTTDVFKAKDDGTHLNLITCDGFWNSSVASYTQRLVVFSDKL